MPRCATQLSRPMLPLVRSINPVLLPTAMLAALLWSSSWARDCIYYEFYEAQGIDPPVLGATTFPDSALALDTQAGHTYVAAGNAGMQVIELSNPEAPLTVGELVWLEPASNIVVGGVFAFVTTAHRLRVVDITFAHAPVELLSISLSGPTHRLTGDDLYPLNELLFATHVDGTLEIIDLDNPAFPSSIAILSAQGIIRDIAVRGQHAYLATSIGLEVADISSPDTPLLVGTGWPAEAGLAVAAQGDSVFLATQDSNLLVIDIADPTNPQLVGNSELPGPAIDLVSDGEELYLASGGGQVWVMRLDLPESVRWLGAVTTAGQALRLNREGPHLYLANGTGGLQLLWPQCEAVDAVPSDDSSDQETGSVQPTHPWLSPAHPNPFNPATTVSYRLPGAGKCRVAVYDLRGRLVSTLSDQYQPAGAHQVIWRGQDDGARAVPSGAYIVRLVANGQTSHCKLLLAR